MRALLHSPWRSQYASSYQYGVLRSSPFTFQSQNLLRQLLNTCGRFVSLPIQAPPRANRFQTIDWCYIFYAVNYQIAAILLATTTRWFLIQALGSNLLWMLPWAIAVTRIGMTPENAWSYDSIIFGGALVFDFFNVSLVVGIWAWYLMRGKVSLAPVYSFH